MKRIVIRVITYNQEDLIGRALDSVLCQKEWGLYRLIVSDDCSTDRTWDILKKYQQEYPDIVKIYRNEKNLGIYGNVAKSEEYLPNDYDLFEGLSGDDAYCEGYFKGLQKLIEEKDIDTNEAVGIYSDWKLVLPSGKEIVFKQDAVLSGCRLWSLSARFLICGRSLMVSRKVRGLFEPLLHGKGLNLMESQYESQPHLHISKAYYLPQTTTCYYSGLGVSSTLSINGKSGYYTTQALEKWNYFMEHYAHDECDMHYLKFEMLKVGFYINPSWLTLCKMFYYYEKGQLKGCHILFRNTIRQFLFLFKYKMAFSRKS